MTGTQKFILGLGVLFLVSGFGILLLERLPEKSWQIAADGPTDEARTKEAEALLREAEEYLRQNSGDSARQAMGLFNRVLSWDLNQKINQEARFGLAVSLERLGDKETSLEYYRALREEGPVETRLADRLDYRLGKALLEINHEEEGKSILDSLLARTLDTGLKSDIHTAIGHHYLRKKMRKKAKNNFTIALKYNPDNLHAELGRAEAEKGTGNYRKAYDYYDNYLLGVGNLNPGKKESVKSHVTEQGYEEGLKAYRNGRYSDAVFHFKKVLATDSGVDLTEKVLYWLAESYVKLGSDSLALQTFDRVILNPATEMDQAALIKKGIIMYNQGKLREALMQFHTAIENYPGGAYSVRAEEWRKETEAQLRENAILKSYSSGRGETIANDSIQNTPENP